MLTLDHLERLRAPAGQALLAAMRAAAPTPATELGVIARLRAAYPSQADLVGPALTLHALRERATEKFTRAGEMWLTREGYEQATAESIAIHRAARFAGCARLADLCCGIGGDLLALARLPGVVEVTAIDRDPVHLAMAVLNTVMYGATAHVRPLARDVRAADLTGVDGAFIDPARRDERGRLATGESEPDLAWCLALAARVQAVGIKAAPGIPHEMLPAGWELETIAMRRDLKEAVLWSPALARVARRATVIEGTAVHTLLPAPGDPVPVREPAAGMVLYDPNPAVTRAGLVDDLARRLGAAKIDAQIGFLIGEGDVPSPFARSLPVVAALPWHERRLKGLIRDLGGGEVTIRRRGLAGDVAAIRKRLRGQGSRPLTIAMTRAADRPWAIVCEG